MRWVSTLSTRASLEAAVTEVVEAARAALEAPADLGLVFISSAFASDYSRLMPLLAERLSVPALIGCSGGGVVGMASGEKAEEIEGKPALSLCLAHLPGVEVRPFHLTTEELPDLDSSPEDWVELIGVHPQNYPQFILLIDPFYGKINDLLQGLDYAYPGAPKVGGLASSGAMGQGTAVFCDGELYAGEAVGVALSGNIVLDTIVAQGCRPIGDPYRITRGDRNIILQVEKQDAAGGGELSPLEALQELLGELGEEDRQLAGHSLFVGVVRDEFKQQLEAGDFLLRNLIGVDPRMGAIAIGDRVRPGQRIQFHLRDARTSAEDLELLLKNQDTPARPGAVQTRGALMFSCLGRGENLYGEPNFDSNLFRRHFPIPLSGFFCNGEIGPVGNGTFLHGYTSVFGICRQPEN
ncbi:FIST N-terminal domain-containing protein [Lyngbya sp. CCY1209]|uniref:FIST signal transduction protein n=1 Tax=Lyngbya sp. CCY1209 TaxID=2886103 RepID=UPI002D204438|nr:FIST N-terminal domain-containing protein [Lyngbya sp. CCY1209]MEB3883340.1 FIST C-terminal domain-containing protein [Lyngbya sp. CCY1209]